MVSLVLFTLLLAIVTEGLVYVAWRQGVMTTRIERAYVKMSHEGGLRIFENPTVRMGEVTVKIENCGRTPASIIDVRLYRCLLAYGEPLPATIDYGESFPHGAPFLVPGDYFFWRDRSLSLGPLSSPDPSGGLIRICLFGYIDYIDAFGRTHRAGYAREYVPRDGNNLVFISEPGYNYDKQIQPQSPWWRRWISRHQPLPDDLSRGG